MCECIVLRAIGRRKDDSLDPLRLLDALDLVLQQWLAVQITQHLAGKARRSRTRLNGRIHARHRTLTLYEGRPT